MYRTRNDQSSGPGRSPPEPDTPMSHYSSHLHEDISTPSLFQGERFSQDHEGEQRHDIDSERPNTMNSSSNLHNGEYTGEASGSGSGSGSASASGSSSQPFLGASAGAGTSNVNGDGAGIDATRRGSQGLNNSLSEPLGGEARLRGHAKGKGSESGLVGMGIASRRGEKMPRLTLKRLVSGATSDEVKGLAKRSVRIGLSHRAWLVLTVIVGLTLFTKLLFPPEGTTVHTHPVDSHSLIPRDYLNNSLTDPAPFEFCPVFGPGDAIAERRGQFELLKSRLHTGTGARVQRVLQKAMSGAPVTISVLGGSISSCVGAGDDPIGEKCYPYKFFNWWNSVFPHPANELTNGATKKTDSAYYAYCNSHHLPDQADLVILEFDAADPNDPDWLAHFELLVRSVLVRPEMPAVIILGHFSLAVQAQNGFAGPELLHNVVAQFYDVPHISVKGVIYEQYLQHPEISRSTFYSDPNHANAEGHDLIADVLISYMMSQICSGWSTLQGHSYEVLSFGGVDSEGSGSGSPALLGGVGLRKGEIGQEPGDGESSAAAGASLTEKYQGLKVPNARLRDRPNDAIDFREIEPFCVAASDLINPLPPSLFYGSGWKVYHPPKNAVVEDRHYWYAEHPTSRLRIPLKLGAGDVGIYFLQSPMDKPLGTVKCWVDDNFGGAKTLEGTADIEEVMATLTLIDRHVSRGSHFVECQLEGEVGTPSPPFKILGVFTT